MSGRSTRDGNRPLPIAAIVGYGFFAHFQVPLAIIRDVMGNVEPFGEFGEPKGYGKSRGGQIAEKMTNAHLAGTDILAFLERMKLELGDGSLPSAVET